MQGVLADGLVGLILYKWEILFFLLTVFSLGRLCTKNISAFQWDETIKPMFTICIGTMVLSGITFLLALLSLLIPIIFKIGSFSVLIFSVSTLFIDIFIKRINLPKITAIISFTVIVIILLLFHLPLLNHIILPGYSDSPTHYQIINQILNPNKQVDTNLSIENILVNYYHFGFHSMTAWLSTITGMAIGEAMSLIGQISLVLVPMSIGSLVFVITKSKLGALSAGLLSMFGWSMPAFAVNWGKFPAILSLALLSSFISYIILMIESKDKSLKNLFSLFILFSCIAIVHTRIIIILLLTLSGLYLAKLFTVRETPDTLYSIRSSLLLIFLLLPLKEYINNYYYDRFSIAILIVFLLPFAFFYYPKQVIGLFFSVSGIWIIQLIFTTLRSSFELLDTQFISIMLFIPFSIIAGLGLAGVIKQFTLLSKPLIMVVLLFIMVYRSPWFFSSLPDPCCNYYKKADEMAFKWINDNTPQDSLFIISTFSDGKQQYGSDAGIWIYPLTERSTNKLPYNATWNDENIFTENCNPNLKEVYIYAGGHDYSFSNNVLSELQWVEAVYIADSISIYKVFKCSVG